MAVWSGCHSPPPRWNAESASAPCCDGRGVAARCSTSRWPRTFRQRLSGRSNPVAWPPRHFRLSQHLPTPWACPWTRSGLRSGSRSALVRIHWPHLSHGTRPSVRNPPHCPDLPEARNCLAHQRTPPPGSRACDGTRSPANADRPRRSGADPGVAEPCGRTTARPFVTDCPAGRRPIGGPEHRYGTLHEVAPIGRGSGRRCPPPAPPPSRELVGGSPQGRGHRR